MAFYTDSKPEQSGYMEDVVDSWSKNVHPTEKREMASFQVTAGRRDQHFAYFRPKKGFFGAFSTDLEKFNGRGPKWHFIPFQRPRRVASWKMSWIHGAKMFIPRRKEDRQVFRSQYIDVINFFFANFRQKKGLLRLFPPTQRNLKEIQVLGCFRTYCVLIYRIPGFHWVM